MQIPLPEGMDFVREVVTNHAVSGGTTGEGPAFLSLSRLGVQPNLVSAPPHQLLPPIVILHQTPPAHLGILFPIPTPMPTNLSGLS